jgi:SAM-dependent methyltransferase
MHWQTKARAFNVLSGVPFGTSLHFMLQRYVTRRLPRPEKQVKAIYLLALRLIEQYARHGSRPLPDSTFFEFGSGRDLVVPLAISACGARQFITVDVERLAKLDLVRSNVGFVANLSGMTRPALSSWEDLRNSWRVDYRAPADARATGIESGTIDCALSVETLEHIPPVDISAILKEIHGILRPDGVAIMQIDYGDHFKGFDPSISSFNFLTYSDEQWEPFQSRFQYVNRLRHSQYLDLFKNAGFEIVLANPDRRPAEPAILSQLASRFHGFTEEDLFTLGALIVARPLDKTRTT